MFFEAPDVKSARGWGTIGKINHYQLIQFRQYLSQRSADSLSTLISDDARFSGEKDQVLGAYAESWALTYFLMKKYSDNYAAYLSELGQLAPLGESKPRERVNLFKKHFGEDLAKLSPAALRQLGAASATSGGR